MNERSLLRSLVRVSRDFGSAIAIRVAYSKIRGVLCPTLALPGAPIYNANRRQVSFLLNAAEQSAATLDGVVEVIARRGELDWEVCICERAPAEPTIARALARIRGTQPWIRIVTTDEFVDEATAICWTAEQATGQFVAFLAPGYIPHAGAIAKLLFLLHNDPAIDAVVLHGTYGGSSSSPLPVLQADCRILLQRKSGYLAALRGRWLLTAAALAQDLGEAGVPIAYISAGEHEAVS